jgi:hypothetical protein
VIAGGKAVIVRDWQTESAVVPVDELALVATLAGEGGEGALCVSARGAETARVLPADLFVGKNGLVTIAGFKGRETVAVTGENVDVGELFLVRRELPWGDVNAVLVGGGEEIEVSRIAEDIAYTGFLQGDEVELGGGVRAVVVGCDRDYVWMVAEDGEFFCTNEELGGGEASLISRPTADPKILFDCFAGGVIK